MSRPLKPKELRLTLHKQALSPDHRSMHPNATVHIARVMLTDGRLLRACDNQRLDRSQYWIFPFLQWILAGAPICRKCNKVVAAIGFETPVK